MQVEFSSSCIGKFRTTTADNVVLKPYYFYDWQTNNKTCMQKDLIPSSYFLTSKIKKLLDDYFLSFGLYELNDL